MAGGLPDFAEAADRRVAAARTDQTARQVVNFFTRKIEVKNYASAVPSTRFTPCGAAYRRR
jgi:hypothetical protein